MTVTDGANDSVVATVAAGDGPIALCHNTTNNKVYCANFYDADVTVIDGATDQVIATVTVGYYPVALCHNSLGNKVYCANTYSGDVSVIDAATNGVITTVPVGSGPGAFCHNPQNNKVYCVNCGYLPASDSTVTVMDGATDRVLKTIAVGNSPGALCHNPVQNRVYVANYGGSSISVLRDSGGGIEESYKPQAASRKLAATVVRGVLWQGDRGQEIRDGAELLDISGRKVMDLRPGANDVRALAPGVYFVLRKDPRGQGVEDSRVTKVVIQR